MKLWLDDERDPNSLKIQEEFGAEPGMIWVKTAQAAINRLQNGDITYVSLDHDLGPISAGTGLDVAKWIEEQAFNNNIEFIEWDCHSLNPVGKKSIFAAMRNAEKYWRKNGLL